MEVILGASQPYLHVFYYSCIISIGILSVDTVTDTTSCWTADNAVSEIYL